MNSASNINEYKELIEQLYIEKKTSLFYEARKRVDCDEDAEEAIHTAFMNLIEAYPRYKQKSYKDLVNLCYKSTIYMAIDISREKTRRRDILKESGFEDEITIGKTDDILETLVKKYDKELLQNALDELPEDDRIILQLRYNWGLIPKDIGTVLKLSSNVVRVRLLRSRKKLQKILLKEEYKELIHRKGKI